ncbi:MAG: hypothetical protein ACR2HX_12515 [Pyrinomonadaceae bacterium]
MKPLSDTQEIVRRFNEEEMIYQRFQQKRLARRLSEVASPLPENILDCLELMEAEREARVTQAVARAGRFSGESTKR